MGDITSWVGMLVFGCGIYCFYAAFQLKVKKVINPSILLSKDMLTKTCKDKEGYIKEMFPVLLFFAFVTTLCGAVDIVNSYVKEVGFVYYIAVGLFIVGFVLFVVKNKKLKQKYY